MSLSDAAVKKNANCRGKNKFLRGILLELVATVVYQVLLCYNSNNNHNPLGYNNKTTAELYSITFPETLSLMFKILIDFLLYYFVHEIIVKIKDWCYKALDDCL